MTKKETNKTPKKENKKIEKENVFKKILTAIKNFFNKPTPLIIALIALNIFLLLYISNYNDKNKIFIGSVEENDVSVVNVHYFTNGDMNYFYASPAQYLLKDQDVYNFEMGYYVKTVKDKLIPLATRSRQVDDKTSLTDAISELSSWSIAEPDSASYFFSDEVMNNIDNLYFRVLASTEKDSTKPDIYIEHEVNVTKVTR